MMALLDNNLMASATSVASAFTSKTHAAATRATAATDATSSSTGSTSSSGDGSDISSNDFLTLLVSELQNQDPTQPTDPNAYIQQLVGVNSLQQLIQINQTLGAASTGTTSNVAGASAPTQVI